MAEQGIGDPLQARRKAAQRLGLTRERDLPGGDAIVAELRNYLALFQPQDHRERLARLRDLAVRAIRRVAPKPARLVGAVLDGTAVDSTPITLHLLDSTAEEIAILLLERGIVHRLREQSVAYGPNDRRQVTAFVIRLDGTDVELLAFPPDAPRQPPLCPTTGTRMVRATADEVGRLLERG